jgi:hypothetical protein
VRLSPSVARPLPFVPVPLSIQARYFLLTVVFCVAELFPLSRSCVVALTIAVLLSTVPDSAVTVTTTLMVAVAPFARLPRFTITVPLLPTAGAVTAP